MIAGLPGTGIGLVFFVISAYFAPFSELIALARGRSSWARWRTVGGLVVTATMVVIGISATTLGLVLASRVIASNDLSPFWRRFSDGTVMVLLVVWAVSAMTFFFAMDLMHPDRPRPLRADRSARLPSGDAAPASSVPASDLVP